MDDIANTPKKSYYAVIFTSIRTDKDNAGYGNAAQRMVDLAQKQPGYLGVESCREDIGITVSYWEDKKSIENWRKNAEHLIIQSSGKSSWYEKFKVRVCKIEYDYGFERGQGQ